MTGHIDRDEWRVITEKWPEQPWSADAVRQLLDALDRAEARIKAVRDVLDQEASDPHIATRVRADTIRRALEG